MKSLLKFLSIGLLTASLASCVSPQPEVPATSSPSEDSATSTTPVESTDSATSTAPIESTDSATSTTPIESTTTSTEPMPEPTPAALTLDFSTITKSLTYNDESMNAAWGSEALTISGVSAVYAGAGAGGCHANEFGLIKMGKSKGVGTFTVNTAEAFAKVTVNCHGFYAPSEKFPNNSNKFDVNGTTVDAPFNDTGAAEALEFAPAEPTKTWTFTSMNRVYVWSITWSN